jgi:hypothetical protein
MPDKHNLSAAALEKIHQPCKMLFKHEPISKISIGIFAFAYIIIKAPGASCRCFCY